MTMTSLEMRRSMADFNAERVKDSSLRPGRKERTLGGSETPDGEKTLTFVALLVRDAQ